MLYTSQLMFHLVVTRLNNYVFIISYKLIIHKVFRIMSSFHTMGFEAYALLWTLLHTHLFMTCFLVVLFFCGLQTLWSILYGWERPNVYVVKDQENENYKVYVQWWVHVRKGAKNDEELYHNCWLNKWKCNHANPK
jgi:hypothetical protein